jgi:multicomponent Na+:H+ antiporter subunit C
MTLESFYTGVSVLLFFLGFYNLIVQPNPMRKLLAINISASGVFLMVLSGSTEIFKTYDTVAHAIVLTGVVVTVGSTAFGLILLKKIYDKSEEKEKEGKE